MPEHGRHQQQAGLGRRRAGRRLQEQRNEDVDREQRGGGQEQRRRRDGDGARAQQPQRDDRIGGPPLAHRQRDAERQGAGDQRAGLGGRPGVAVAAPDAGQHQAAGGGRQQPCAGNVERPGRRRRLGGRQPQAQAGQRRDPQRQVHVEHPAPGRVVDQQPAGERAGDRRRREHRGDVALVAAALARRHQVADRRHGEAHQPARGHSLHRAEGDQHGDVRRQPAGSGRREEHRQRQLEHRLAAAAVT